VCALSVLRSLITIRLPFLLAMGKLLAYRGAGAAARQLKTMYRRIL
jgi:hypothetical protein